jgi:hypothetical protein
MLSKKLVFLQLALVSLALPAVAAPPPVPRGPEYRINTNVRQSNRTSSIAAFPDDSGFVVVWATSSADYRARFLDNQGRPTGGDVLLGVDGVNQVAADRDGSFLVVWADFPASGTKSNIYVRRFNRDGSPRGKRTPVNAPSTNNRYLPVITIGPDSRFAVAWREEIPAPDETGWYTNAVARIFTAQGIPFTPEITLHTGEPAPATGAVPVNAFPSSLALKPGGTLAALVQDLEGDCLRSYLAQVPPDGEPLPLQPLGSLQCGIPKRDLQTASLAMGRDGSLVATWSDFMVRAQRFAPDGTPWGEAFSVSADVVGFQYEPVVALQAGGSFVIAWTEENRDGNGLGLFARSFAASGAARTRDFRLNTRAEGDQSDSAIAALRQGSAVVVWTNQPPAAGRSDIAARVLVPRQ